METYKIFWFSKFYNLLCIINSIISLFRILDWTDDIYYHIITIYLYLSTSIGCSIIDEWLILPGIFSSFGWYLIYYTDLFTKSKLMFDLEYTWYCLLILYNLYISYSGIRLFVLFSKLPEHTKKDIRNGWYPQRFVWQILI